MINRLRKVFVAALRALALICSCEVLWAEVGLDSNGHMKIVVPSATANGFSFIRLDHGVLLCVGDDGVMFNEFLGADHRQCAVWDIERGTGNTIKPQPFQTDTCIGLALRAKGPRRTRLPTHTMCTKNGEEVPTEDRACNL